jgi:hypothetical protein
MSGARVGTELASIRRTLCAARILDPVQLAGSRILLALMRVPQIASGSDH